MSALVLVVDDDAAIREMTALALEKAGYRVQRAASAAEARRMVAREKPALVVCDLYMPGEDGLSLLASLGDAPPAFLMMTARGSMETAAEAARTGAFDYLAKPFDVSTLLERAQAALATHVPAATSEEGPEGLIVSIVGSHPAIVDVYRAVARVASMRVPVLVVGETGTGKALVATALHRFGTRSSGPFVPVHCGALPDTLLESELFGHRKGAFTDAHRDRRGALQAAHGGTVFLDEIGDVSQLFQVKLLRFLEESVVTPLGADRGEPVDVRVVAATHRDLRAMVAEGRFRQDLFYRLAGYEIRIPPLRERLSDLPALVARFRALAEEETGVAAGDVGDPSPEVLAVLAAHTWPGNVRELRLAVRRIVIEAGRLDDAVVARRVLVGLGAREEDVESAAPPPAAEEGLETLEEVERRHVQRVLEASGGNRSEAARLLGIDRKTLARKLKEPEA